MVEASSRQLENVVDDITKQLVHTTHIIEQDYQMHMALSAGC